MVTLFLDFDGVLHPDAVYLTRKGPQLRGEGRLFMWAHYLTHELQAFPELRIVLSTSWVRYVGFSKAKKRLPLDLQCRVVGATWHSSMAKELTEGVWWDQSSRYQQILKYLAHSPSGEWLAIDDDLSGWAEADRHKVIATLPELGLSSELTRAELHHKLGILSGHSFLRR